MKNLRTNLLDVKKGDEINFVNGGKCGPSCSSTNFEIHSEPTMILAKASGVSEGVYDEKEFNNFVNAGQVNLGFKVKCPECKKLDFVTLDELNKMKNHLEIHTP